MNEHEELYFDQIIAGILLDAVIRAMAGLSDEYRRREKLHKAVHTRYQDLIAEGSDDHPGRPRIERFLMTLDRLYNRLGGPRRSES